MELEQKMKKVARIALVFRRIISQFAQQHWTCAELQTKCTQSEMRLAEARDVWRLLRQDMQWDLTGSGICNTHQKWRQPLELVKVRRVGEHVLASPHWVWELWSLHHRDFSFFSVYNVDGFAFG